MRNLPLLLLCVAAVGGCHARFKRHVEDIRAVRVEVLPADAPTVWLGRQDAGEGLVADIADVVVNTKMAIDESKIAARVNKAVDPEASAAALQERLSKVLQDGPPFRVRSKGGDAVLELEVVDFGLSAAAPGQQAVFDTQVRAKIYLDGETVYRAVTSCSVEAGRPGPFWDAVGWVDNARQIKELDRAEIQAAFDDVAAACGQEVARKIRKHAG
jgi:hypothetical protein